MVHFSFKTSMECKTLKEINVKQHNIIMGFFSFIHYIETYRRSHNISRYSHTGVAFVDMNSL